MDITLELSNELKIEALQYCIIELRKEINNYDTNRGLCYHLAIFLQNKCIKSFPDDYCEIHPYYPDIFNAIRKMTKKRKDCYAYELLIEGHLKRIMFCKRWIKKYTNYEKRAKKF